MAPIVCNPDFAQYCSDVGFKIWKDAGISKIQNLFLGGTIKSFSQLRTKFDLPRAHFFHSLQLRSYIRSIPIYKSGLYMNHLEKTLVKASSLRKLYVIFIIKCLLTVIIKHLRGIHLDD